MSPPVRGLLGRKESPVWQEFVKVDGIPPDVNNKIRDEIRQNEDKDDDQGAQDGPANDEVKIDEVKENEVKEDQDGGSGPKKRRLITPKITDSVIATSDAQLKKIQEAWAKFYYRHRLSHRLADSEEFKEAMEITRPGITTMKPHFTARRLNGPLLDSMETKGDKALFLEMNGKYAVLTQDGWSDIHQCPVIAANVICEGKSHPVDFKSTSDAKKTSEYCFETAKESIEAAEEKYGVKIVGFCSDNENKMNKVRKLLSEWRQDFITYGCSAHLLNLVESSGSPADILNKIVAVNKFFRDHHRPAALLKKLGGKIPQLPNSTRWNSQAAAFETFIYNYNIYCTICDDPEVEIPQNIVTFVSSRFLLNEAKNMSKQLSHVAAVLNLFQSDEKNLSDAVKAWLELLENPDMSDEIKEALKKRFGEAATNWHCIAYLMDPRRKRTWPNLPAEMASKARDFLTEKGDEMTAGMVGYEAKDDTMLPKILFSESVQKLHPIKYWKYFLSLVLFPSNVATSSTRSEAAGVASPHLPFGANTLVDNGIAMWNKFPALREASTKLCEKPYLGDWYQVQGIPTFFSPSDSTCIRATYGQNDDGTVSVHNVLNYPDGSFGEICGFAYSPDSENPGDLIVEFPQSPKGDYWILGTDYENWASVYACEDIIGIKFEYGWVLTRDPNPAQEYVDASFAAFTNGGVGLEAFEVNPQGNCTYEDTTVVSCADQ
eukprot:maker-scaffold894_size84319-snap-gene-0.10 protein:Tk08704 transcript:maker-scaffold894_size84319-snap-gene-0.10-mRNA-1 annotation:"PREDICTED: uncharacterized protein LOC103307970"